MALRLSLANNRITNCHIISAVSCLGTLFTISFDIENLRFTNSTNSNMDPTVSRFEQNCPDCDGRDFVDDTASGDLICKVLTRHACSAARICMSFSNADSSWNPTQSMRGPNGEPFLTLYISIITRLHLTCENIFVDRIRQVRTRTVLGHQ